MIQAPSITPVLPGQVVQYTDRNGRTYEVLVTAVGGGNVTFTLPTGNMTVPRSQVRTNAIPCVLDNIPQDSWTITSFDPSTRVVCIDIRTSSGIRHLSITLPTLYVNSL